MSTPSDQQEEHGKTSIKLHKAQSIDEPFLTVDRGDTRYAISICHRIPERSIHFRGTPLLCYRCTGIYTGIAIIFLYQVIGFIIGFELLLGPVRPWFVQITNNNIWLQIMFVIVLQLPLVLDGSLQASKNSYSSNNPLRFLTGLISGFGIFAIVLVLGSIVMLLN